MIDYVFSLEDNRNTFGMHEDGVVSIFLCNYNFKNNIPKIIEIIEHETLHWVIRECLEQKDLEWANQERIIGKIRLVQNAKKGTV